MTAGLCCSTVYAEKLSSKVQYWQVDIPGPIRSYCFYEDIFPSPNLLQLPVLHLYQEERVYRRLSCLTIIL